MSEAGGADFADLGELARVVANGKDVGKMLRTATLLEYLQEWEPYQVLLTSALQAQRKLGQDKAAEAGLLTRLAKSWLALDSTHPNAFSFAEEALKAWKEVGDPEQVAAAAILYVSTPKGASEVRILEEAEQALKAMPNVPEAMHAIVLLRLGTNTIERENPDWGWAHGVLQHALTVADCAFGSHHHERAAMLLQLARVKAHYHLDEEAEALCQEALVSPPDIRAGNVG